MANQAIGLTGQNVCGAAAACLAGRPAQLNVSLKNISSNTMTFAETTINHKGTVFRLPFVISEATSVNIYSLFDYENACILCDQENFRPIVIKGPDGMKKAAGAVAAFDYKNTSALPYREWSIVFFVVPKSQKIPEVNYTNETSLFFQSILADPSIGNSVFSSKLVLTESLPTEIGTEYYGLPKELGQVTYDYHREVSNISVSTGDNVWIMKASFPTQKGISAKFKMLWALLRAFGFKQVIQSMGKKEFSVTLLGSAKILAKKACMKIKNDPKTEMYPWGNRDCKMEINPESEWGKVLLELKLQPRLICHVPNLKFEFSEPVDQ